MKAIMKSFEEVRDFGVFNLKWKCPHCAEENIEYYFSNWKYEVKFWCGCCHKVVWREIKENK